MQLDFSAVVAKAGASIVSHIMKLEEIPGIRVDFESLDQQNENGNEKRGFDKEDKETSASSIKMTDQSSALTTSLHPKEHWITDFVARKEGINIVNGRLVTRLTTNNTIGRRFSDVHHKYSIPTVRQVPITADLRESLEKTTHL